MNLSPRQKQVLEVVKKWVAEKGETPTYQEIGAVLGITKCAVFEHVCALEMKGMVRRSQAARSLELVEQDPIGATVDAFLALSDDQRIEAMRRIHTAVKGAEVILKEMEVA